jgi:2-polyprenyl-3-methyl-5-hydroxy-6-metoxy-1,4-benzoquinol methylase
MSDLSKPVDWNANELESVPVCPACGAISIGYRYEELHDHLENVPGSWALRDCIACRSVFLDPRPTLQSIGKAYASYYTHGSGAMAYAEDNGRSVFWKLANGYMNARYGSQRAPASWVGRWMLPLALPIRQQLDFFYRHLPKEPGQLLDVGCGNGLFLLRARAAGWKVMGLEPDPIAAATAGQCGLDVHVGTMDNFHETRLFDVVTSSHVIEHVHDPAKFLMQMFCLLRAGGTLWLATPNVQSMGHLRYGRSWRGLEPPRHLTIFSAGVLSALLTKAGFSDIQFHRRGRGASYILNSSRELAKREGRNIRNLSTKFADLRATWSVTAAEELVVTGRKFQV